MAAAVPAVAALLPLQHVPAESPAPDRFVRVCIRHKMPVEESMVHAGHGHVEMIACPGNQQDRPHRVYAWGVYDLWRGRVLAVGSERRIILIEGFDLPAHLKFEDVADVPAYVQAADNEGEKTERPWLRGMAKLPAPSPRKARSRTWPISVPKNVCAAPEEVEERSWHRLSDAELDAIKTEAWKPDADQVAIGRAHRISATTVLKIKHGMVGH